MDHSKEPTLTLLASTEFQPEKYVKHLSQNYVGGSELQAIRKKIQALSEDTNNNLKKNVYQNYGQFIDTAKEISHLESEMYQLSHLLSEQKSLLNSLASTSLMGDNSNLTRNKERSEEKIIEEQKQKTQSILEKVEGCKDVLDIPGRTFLHEGDLLELDSLENKPIKPVHVYLFNDGFMITSRNSNSRGLMKYKFEVMYELGSLAVVNVRDLGDVKHAFKLLIFPETRIFQCSSNSNKKDWLDKFDQAKKNQLSQDVQRRESIIERSPSRTTIESGIHSTLSESEDDLVIITHPEWFLDLPEELDVGVAQRHFEEAITLLQKGKDYMSQLGLPNAKTDHVLIDIQRKLDMRQSSLTEVLMKELEINPDKSLQGGLRAARRAVRLLNQLGRSTQSCDLFLKLCSSMLKIQCKRVKREGSTSTYIRHLSSVVFTNMCHMTDEFLRAFPESSVCASAYIVWASSELSSFSAHFIKQVFVPQTSLATITECVFLVKTQCERLCNYGIDLCYQLDGALLTPLTKALTDTRDKLIDSVKVRALEDKWIPTNFHTKNGLSRCLNEHREMGLQLDSYVTGDIWLQLTQNTIAFTKVFLALLECCLRLKTTELLYTVDTVLYEIYGAQLKHYELTLKKDLQKEERQFIIKNTEFLLVTLYNLIQRKYTKSNGFECKTFAKVQIDYAALMKICLGNRNIKTKYSSEFL
ncbi:unnamed protein product [Brassicogethes aeneus]|uniref:Exocyst complex component 8 n=1 Tax=Brassicogethes aeneus TaxID=1431903 RepID=A0A9P0B6H2_BRAAE|nr:unnamed protein product [Brassicogethes aeneus]